jgi:hypothetical protein
MEALRLREQQATLNNASEPTTVLLERAAKIPPGVMDQGTMYRSPAAFRTGPVPAAATSRAAFEPIFNEDAAAVTSSPQKAPVAALPAVASSLPAAAPAAVGYLEETPEVKAARAAFLQAYKAALAVQPTPGTSATTAAPAVAAAATGAVGLATAGRLSAAAPSFNTAYARAGGLPFSGAPSPYLPYLG